MGRALGFLAVISMGMGLLLQIHLVFQERATMIHQKQCTKIADRSTMQTDSQPNSVSHHQVQRVCRSKHHTLHGR